MEHHMRNTIGPMAWLTVILPCHSVHQVIIEKTYRTLHNLQPCDSLLYQTQTSSTKPNNEPLPVLTKSPKSLRHNQSGQAAEGITSLTPAERRNFELNAKKWKIIQLLLSYIG
jgi:hypothetical protein